MEKSEVLKSSEDKEEKKGSKRLFWIIAIFIIIGITAMFLIGGNGNNGFNRDNEINPGLIQVYFFWSATCPHCAEQKPFMQEMVEKYDKLQLFSYEIQFDRENAELFNDFEKKHSVPEEKMGWVPATFIGDKYFLGFDEGVAADIEAQIKLRVFRIC